MTRDEYVKWLKQLDENLKFDGLIDGDKEVDLHEMIFDLCEMLEQQTCGDAVSRQAVEKITWEEPSYTDALNVLTEVREKIRQLSSVNPQPICEEREKGECPYYAG